MDVVVEEEHVISLWVVYLNDEVNYPKHIFVEGKATIKGIRVFGIELIIADKVRRGFIVN